MLGLIIISIALLVLVVGNVYQIPAGNIDHTNDAEYIGTFKNWVKLQEIDSVLWMIAHDLDSSTIIGDEVTWRLYNMNSPDFNGYWWSGNFSIIMISGNYDILRELNGYLFIRKENFYQIINLGHWSTEKDLKIDESIYNKILNLNRYGLIYSNGEVTVFSSYE